MISAVSELKNTNPRFLFQNMGSGEVGSLVTIQVSPRKRDFVSVTNSTKYVVVIQHHIKAE